VPLRECNSLWRNGSLRTSWSPDRLEGRRLWLGVVILPPIHMRVRGVKEVCKGQVRAAACKRRVRGV
jgi:hypothetical protein